MTRKISALLLLIALTGTPFFFAGCVTTDPGSDPVVVNAERLDKVAFETFVFVLKVDATDRNFWETNAPAFHNFCEWLRVPIPVVTTNAVKSLPRDLALIYEMDRVKNEYKAHRATVADLTAKTDSVESAFSQASAWSTIASNAPAH